MSLPKPLQPIAFLGGDWVGEGEGRYPTIEPFRYSEEITFACDGRPFFAYRQHTRNIDGSGPLHTEAGFWRPGTPGRVEAVIAQATGFASVEEGEVEGGRIHLRAASLGATATAKEVHTIERIIEVSGAEMRYELWMAAVGHEHQIHLAAELHRVTR